MECGRDDPCNKNKSDSKLSENNKILIMLLQETHVVEEIHFNVEGHLVIYAPSEHTEGNRSFTGVGFVIAPVVTPWIIVI